LGTKVSGEEAAAQQQTNARRGAVARNRIAEVYATCREGG
jgi:hypothetical protein